MIRVLIVAGLILAVMVLFNYYRRSDSGKKRQIIRNLLFLILAVTLVGLVASGRLNWIVAVSGRWFRYFQNYLHGLQNFFHHY